MYMVENCLSGFRLSLFNVHNINTACIRVILSEVFLIYQGTKNSSAVDSAYMGHNVKNDIENTVNFTYDNWYLHYIGTNRLEPMCSNSNK